MLSRRLRVLLIISLSICLIFNVFSIIPLRKVTNENFWIENEVQISAHRGGALLNPENTKKAFDYVIKETDYTDIVEIDLRLTKDNIIVINHDGNINRMALSENESSISINDYNYVNLLEYNLGRNFVDLDGNKPYFNYSVLKAKEEGLTLMSLEDFFSEYNNYRDIKVFLEIKESGESGKYIVDEIIKMIEGEYEWWKTRSMFITFDDELVNYIYDKYDYYVGALGDKVGYQIGFIKMGLDLFYFPNYQSIQVPYNQKAKDMPLIDLATKDMITRAHKRNQLVVYWGVNNKKDMEKLIAIGVDVITTDRPDLLANILK